MLENSTLFVDLIIYLHQRNIIVIKHGVKEVGEHVSGWLSSKYLHLFGDWDMEWEAFATSLTVACIKIHDSNDIIVWCLNKQWGNVTSLLAYNSLVEKHLTQHLTWSISWV